MKRFLAVLLCGFLIITAIPMQAFAKSMDSELEDAIKAVKSKVEVPASYTDFDYYFNTPDSYDDSYLSLTWRDSKDSSYVQVNCDKNNHITYYSYHNYSEKVSTTPQYLKNELKTTAENFIKKVAPDIASKLRYVSATATNAYDGSYQYYFERQENGIPFPDNNVTVSVNNRSGKVETANIRWLYDVAIPSAKADLSLSDATKKITENVTMKLVYHSNYVYYFAKDASEAEKAFLVYEPDKQYIAIDAKNGKVYTTNGQVIFYGENTSAADGVGNSGKDTGSIQLTEEELKEIDNLKNLKSKETAIKAVKNNKYLLIDKNLKKENATLVKVTDQSGAEKYVWYIDLSDPRAVSEKDTSTYRAYAFAKVDAKTGKILQFYTTVKDYYNMKTGRWDSVTVKYKKSACQTILEKFFKNELADKYSKTKLTEEEDGYIASYTKTGKAIYGGYNFIYNRYNDGIEYANNSLQGSVDGMTGKIYSISSAWSDRVVFESKSGAISKSKAMESYLKVEDGFRLIYEINQVDKYDANASSNTTKYEIRLVYRTDVNPPYISPFTGGQLNYDGSAYTKTKAYSYLDIDDSEQYRAVRLLSDMNVGFDGSYFYPNKEIMTGELYTLLNGLGIGSAFETSGSGSTSLITREEIAYYFIKCLSLTKLADIPGIYTTGFNDQGSIDSKYIGAVAIAKGLGIVSGDSSNNFNPKKNVTRLEAANMIMNFMKVQNQGIY